MNSYQKLKKKRDEYADLFKHTLTNLELAENTLWEIESLKDGEEWKAPKMARSTLRILRNSEETE